MFCDSFGRNKEVEVKVNLGVRSATANDSSIRIINRKGVKRDIDLSLNEYLPNWANRFTYVLDGTKWIIEIAPAVRNDRRLHGTGRGCHLREDISHASSLLDTTHLKLSCRRGTMQKRDDTRKRFTPPRETCNLCVTAVNLPKRLLWKCRCARFPAHVGAPLLEPPARTYSPTAATPSTSPPSQLPPS